MNTDIETLLVAGMRAAVADTPEPTPQLVARAVRGHRRRTTVRRVAASAGALGVAASVGIALTVTATGNRSPGQGPASGQVAIGGSAATGSPALRLIAALTATQQTSYRLDQTVTGTYLDRADLDPIYKRLTARADLGRHLLSGTFAVDRGDVSDQVRIVGDDLFVTMPRPGGGTSWLKSPGGQDRLRALLSSGWTEVAPWDGFSSDARSLVAALRSDGTVRLVRSSGSGAQAVDTYAFSYDRKDNGVYAAQHISGTVSVHRQSQLIERFEAGTTSRGHIEQSTIRWRVVITFSDYGVPVTVKAPAGAVERGPAKPPVVPPPTPASS